MAEPGLPIYVGPIIVVVAVIGLALWMLMRGKKD